MKPYDHIPFHWSVHRQERANAPIKRNDYLAENTSDPRVPFLESLCKVVKGAGSIVVFNEPFEATRLDELVRDYWRWADAPAASSRRVVRKPAAVFGS